MTCWLFDWHELVISNMHDLPLALPSSPNAVVQATFCADVRAFLLGINNSSFLDVVRGSLIVFILASIRPLAIS